MGVRYRRGDQVVSRQAHGNVYVLPPAHADVVVLTGTATELWRIFSDPSTVDEAVRRLATVFDAPLDEIGQDVSSTVAELAAHDVLAVA